MTKHADSSDKTYKYEVGFLLVPTLSQDQVTAFVEKLHASIKSFKGSVESDGAPAMKTLAYEMSKATAGKRSKYKTAFFGWTIFNLPASEAPAFKAELEKMNEVIRFLFIKKERDTVYLSPQDVEGAEGESAEGEKDDAKAKESAEVSPEELDKKIDNLVV